MTGSATRSGGMTMTDELVKRLRADNDESFVETLCGEAADRIEALTAERDRLRETLEQFLIEYDVVDLANAEPSSLTAAVLAARAALKGGSHD